MRSKKGAPFIWTEQRKTAFLTLTSFLCSVPVLGYPELDRPFILQTDASNVGLGALLAQIDSKGKERVVSYANRSLTPGEKTIPQWKRKHLLCYLPRSTFEFIGRQ